jgi:hypothetical protein
VEDRMKKIVCSLAILGLVIGARGLRAEEPSPATATTPVVAPAPAPEEVYSLGQVDTLIGNMRVHGFVSQGYMRSTANNYLAETKDGSADFFEAGINFNASVTEQLGFGLQLFSYKLGPRGDYDPTLEWGFLDYKPSDQFGLRVGRIKLPFGLYNELIDVDIGRTPALLPPSVYSAQTGGFWVAVVGADLHGEIALGPSGGALQYDGVLGKTQPKYIDLEGSQADTRNLFVGRLMWETPLTGLKLGVSAGRAEVTVTRTLPVDQVIFLKAQSLVPSDFSGDVMLHSNNSFMWIASFEYTYQKLVLAAEYGRLKASLSSKLGALVPDIRQRQEMFYAMASYNVIPWLTLGAYFSGGFPDYTDRAGKNWQSNASLHRQSDAHTFDSALTLRFDVNSYWSVKLEGHDIDGTTYVEQELNPNNDVKSRWGLFVAKTSIAF